MKDVIIVGGGIAGLTAGWALKEKDILLLESDSRIGGRVISEKRGDFWLNWGGHVYAGKGSATEKLFNSVGVDARPVPGLLSAMSLNGKLLLGGRVELYPFRVPMSWKSRLALIRAGAKVRAAVIRYGQIAKRRSGESYVEQQQRILEFVNNKTFTDYSGSLPEDADAIFRPTVSRSTGDPEQISAGAGVGYFHMIWDKEEGLSNNIYGGPSTMTQKIANTLGDSIKLNAQVTKVEQRSDHVIVSYFQNNKEYIEKAKYVIMTTPAPITRKLAININENIGKALDEIKYGPHVSASFLTNENEPQPWDNVYAFATPKRSFDVLIHNSNVVHQSSKKRKQGSSFMTFSPAQRGRVLLDKSDEEIINIYLNDLEDIFPGFSEKVVESHVKKFPYGSAYIYPGRANIQKILIKPRDRVFLAGDYLGTFYTETAIQTGYSAAEHVLKQL